MVTSEQVQQIAKQTIQWIAGEIQTGMRLKAVREKCEQHMRELGAETFWYHGVGAFVFLGDQTALSVSGRSYQTPDSTIAENDLITIDLSPQIGNTWGDYARTLIIQQGAVCSEIGMIRNEEWRNGLLMEERLHQELKQYASPDTTFEQLHAHINELIVSTGFVNLDFHGNLGHSIEKAMDDRIYIEQGNEQCIGEGRLFTFEPHISLLGSCYGYKKENIYYFEKSQLIEL